jgi:hypothetical protein
LKCRECLKTKRIKETKDISRILVCQKQIRHKGKCKFQVMTECVCKNKNSPENMDDYPTGLAYDLGVE